MAKKTKGDDMPIEKPKALDTMTDDELDVYQSQVSAEHDRIRQLRIEIKEERERREHTRVAEMVASNLPPEVIAAIKAMPENEG